MTIWNKSKTRSDVVKQMEAYMKIQERVIGQFFDKKENKNIDFQSLWQKVMVGNVRFFNREKMDDYLTEEEQHFLARYHRYTVEHAANYIQKVKPISDEVQIEVVEADGVKLEWQIVPNANMARVLLFLHGGGYIMSSANGHRKLSVEIGKATKMRVLSVDYRLAPEYPHPAPLEDSVSVYKWLLSRGIKPENILIAGDSAGGNLTLTTLVKLHKENTSLPAGAICLSPKTDYSKYNDSYFKNAETDPYLADAGIFWWDSAHLRSSNRCDPLVSPIFADLKGFPPILIQASTCEMLIDDSTSFAEYAKNAGVDVKLELWDDMLHIFQAFNLPETEEAMVNIGNFAKNLLN